MELDGLNYETSRNAEMTATCPKWQMCTEIYSVKSLVFQGFAFFTRLQIGLFFIEFWVQTIFPSPFPEHHGDSRKFINSLLLHFQEPSASEVSPTL